MSAAFLDLMRGAIRSIPKQNCMGLKSNLDVESLWMCLDDIDENIDYFAKQQGHDTDAILNWMQENEEFILESLKKKLEDKGYKCCADRKGKRKRKKGKKSCFGWCPNLRSRYQLSKKEENYVQDVGHLLKEIRRTYEEEALSKTKESVARAAVTDFINFRSRKAVSEEIMEALQSPGIDSIGVYGEAGVGKTMLVKKFKAKAEKRRLFDDVVMAKVAKNPDWRRIQDDIACDLGLELPPDISTATGADRIKSRLADRKVLVILDDIWARIELEQLGIPYLCGNKHRQKNKEISSVEEQPEGIVLLTSRDPDVLSSGMHAQKIIEVGRLEEEEAWELFEKIAGREQAKNRVFQRTAEIEEKIAGEKPISIAEIEEIVKECNQLPISIVTLARTLEGKNVIQWRNTIKKLRLRRPCQSEVNLSGMSPSLCSAIKLRYSELEVKELKQTLLLCSLMGHNAGIQDLLKYGIGLGLFPKANSIEEARDEALKLVKELSRSPSFLLEGGSNVHFDMHDSIRDVAISIASEEHSVLALREDAAKDRFDMEAMKIFKWIYLSNCDASQLPCKLTCPQLTFFHLSTDQCPQADISNDLFEGTKSLKVLGLAKVHFLSMPSSISQLEDNLHTLCLDQSLLKDLDNIGSTIGKLKNLEVLSLVGCDIEELPKETKELAKLKLLDLSNCTKLKVIPPDVLKSLSQLEELYLGNSFDQWEDIRGHENRRNASLDELTQLDNLTSLEVCIHNIQIIPDVFFAIELKRYKIVIGDVWNCWGRSFESSKTLKLKSDGSISFDKVKKLLNKAEELHLDKLNSAKNVVDELDKNGFQELKYLNVKNDPVIQHMFFNSVKQITSEVFPKLEVLFLHNLMRLQKIFHGQFKETSFKKLRIISVTGCNQLKNLFCFSVAKQLLCLQKIRVTDCSNIAEIVDNEKEESANIITDEEANDLIELAAQIQCLRLQRLTEFISFSQEKITRFSNTSLFDKKLVPWPRRWNLTKLIIEGCDKLQNLFSLSIVRCLSRLKHLEIRECKNMTEIMATEHVEEMSFFIGLGELNFLQIEDLQNLTRFCSPGEFFLSFQSLKQLAIENCPELKGFVVDDSTSCTDITALFDKVLLPELERMTISHSKNLKILWHKFDANCFPSLNFLRIEDLQNLIGLCSENCSTYQFNGLKQLTIENCPKLKGFLVESTSTDTQALLDEKWRLAFPKLERMTIDNCPELKGFVAESMSGNITSDAGALFDEKLAFPKLERMTISHLKSLKILWKNFAENSFCNLRSLMVTYCQNLSTIFPSNSDMHKKLLESLEELKIIGCSSAKEVFELGQLEDAKEIFQQLKFITIADCPNMVAFTSTFSRDQGQDICNPFFCSKVEFPNLELLLVEDSHKFKYLMTFSIVQSFSQLKKLVIRGCKKMQEVIMIEEFKEENRISLLPKLDSMELEDLPELARFFGPQNLPLTTFFVFPKVTELKFSKLPKLASFLPMNATEWPRLTSIHVCECNQLQIFALEIPTRDNQLESQTQRPIFWVNKGFEGQEGSSRSNTKKLSTVSFVSLKTLDVSRCHGLVTLLDYTIAKRLDQLSTMSITDCSNLQEIVACGDDEVNDGIFFKQLTSLRLDHLSSLESFCSGECNFNFPSLQELIVSECPKMNIFSKGVVKAEKLRKVKLTEEDDVGIWKDDDLNSSIQHLFTNKLCNYALVE